MIKTKIKIQKNWEVQFKKPVYSCSISNLIGNPPSEIIGCSYDETMRVYNLQGKQLMVNEFSPEITTFIVAPITEEKNAELLSGDIYGIVRLLGKQDNLIWDINLNSPVICGDIGDFLGNGEKEVVLGLQNMKIIILNNTGQVLEAFKAPESIKDCTIIDQSDNFIGRLIVLLKDGRIINFDKDGRWQEIFQLDNNPSSIKFNKLFENQIFIIGYKNGSLKISDLEGDILGEIILKDKIRCLNRNLPITEIESNRFIAVASGNLLYSFELFETNKKVDGKSIKKLVKPSTEIVSEKIEPLLTGKTTQDFKEQEIIKDVEPTQVHDMKDLTKSVSTSKVKKYSHGERVKVGRGGQIEGNRYIFKIKVMNEREYNITDVNIQILSYPEESLTLIREKPRDDNRNTYPDRVKFHKITKGGFASPNFIFLPKTDCIKGKIRAVVNFLNESDEIETIIMEPYEIKVICGLLQPNPITVEEFDKFSQDIVNFQKVGEELEVLIESNQLYEKIIVLLEKKNFSIVDTEKQTIGGKFFGILKAFAKGSYSKNKFGIQITITGSKSENKSLIKIETFSQDIDMSPAIINEIENSIVPKQCPECGHNIPPELLQRIIKNKTTYCENCGASLLNSDLT